MTKAALVITDFQRDFCPGGSLAVRGGDEIGEVINRLAPHFHVVVATKDWHPPDHMSFQEQGGPWPVHCVQGTVGAQLHPSLDTAPIQKIFPKATDPRYEAYSGFDGSGLADYLRGEGVTDIYIVGLTTDYCVKTTTLDGLRDGFKVHVIEDAIRAVNVRPDDGDNAIREMKEAGAEILSSRDITGYDGAIAI